MRYLVIIDGDKPYLTRWFDYENHWCDKITMVCDIPNYKYTVDGKNWHPIIFDQL